MFIFREESTKTPPVPHTTEPNLKHASGLIHSSERSAVPPYQVVAQVAPPSADQEILLSLAVPLAAPIDNSPDSSCLEQVASFSGAEGNVSDFADAFNVASTHGRLPTELLEENGEDPLESSRAVTPIIETKVTRKHHRTSKRPMDIFRRLRDMRADVLRTRLRVHEARSSLRYEREDLSDRDARFLQTLRVLFSDHNFTATKSVLDDFEALQETRNALQPKEDDYNRLEDQLNREEWDMKELEARFYERSFSAQTSLLGEEHLTTSTDQYDASDTTPSTRGGPNEFSPQKNRYLSRVGDAKLLEERLVELRIERAQLIEEELVRAQVGLELDEISQNFLRQFDARHDAIQQELLRTEEDVSNMQDKLSEKGDIFLTTDQFPDDPRRSISAQSLDRMTEEEFSLIDMNLSPEERDELFHDPLLLAESDESPVFPQDFVDEADGARSVASYINYWLLHKLRKSSLEVWQFRNVEELKKLNLSPEKVKELVLELWWNDDMTTQFITAREVAAQSLDGSNLTTKGQIPKHFAKSELLLLHNQQPFERLRKSRSLRARNIFKGSLNTKAFASSLDGQSKSSPA